MDETVTLENVLTKGGIEDSAVERVFIDELLSGLDKEEHQIIKLRYFQNKTQAQVAQILQISQVQVSRKERKILKSLRGFL